MLVHAGAPGGRAAQLAPEDRGAHRRRRGRPRRRGRRRRQGPHQLGEPERRRQRQDGLQERAPLEAVRPAGGGCAAARGAGRPHRQGAHDVGQGVRDHEAAEAGGHERQQADQRRGQAGQGGAPGGHAPPRRPPPGRPACSGCSGPASAACPRPHRAAARPRSSSHPHLPLPWPVRQRGAGRRGEYPGAAPRANARDRRPIAGQRRACCPVLPAASDDAAGTSCVRPGGAVTAVIATSAPRRTA